MSERKGQGFDPRVVAGELRRQLDKRPPQERQQLRRVIKALLPTPVPDVGFDVSIPPDEIERRRKKENEKAKGRRGVIEQAGLQSTEKSDGLVFEFLNAALDIGEDVLEDVVTETPPRKQQSDSPDGEFDIIDFFGDRFSDLGTTVANFGEFTEPFRNAFGDNAANFAQLVGDNAGPAMMEVLKFIGGTAENTGELIKSILESLHDIDFGGS